MKISKYFKWHNYYKFAKRKYLDIKFKSDVIKIEQTNYFGVKMLVRANEDVGKEILLNRFELDELNYLKEVLPIDAVILDVGANIGFFSLMLSSIAKRNQVHAFEPIELNANIISVSKEINKFKNLVINQTCVGDSDGFVEFSVASDSAFSSILDSGRSEESEKIRCAICKLDTYVKNANILKIDFIKIDVEGAEKIVLLGANSIFMQYELRPKLVMIELYDLNLKQFGTSIKEVVDIMSAHGYSAYILKTDKLINFDYIQHANKIPNVFFKNNR